MSLTNIQKKEWAKLLYLRGDDLTQKEIAKKVDVAEKTMSKWVKTENWDRLKASIIVTKEESLRRIYSQINEINAFIEKKPEGQRYAIGKEADALSKLANAARSLETETSVSDIIEVFKRFLNWLRPIDLVKSQEISGLQDSFVKTVLK